MSNDVGHSVPTVFSSKERAALVSRALSEAARRARFSTRRRSLTATGFRARQRGRLFKLLRILSFVGLFVLPTAVAIAYFGFIASDQYVAEARFTVRGGTPPTMDRLGAMTGAPPMMIIQDTQVIINYLKSRTLVEALDHGVDMRALYDKDDIDWFSRIDRDRPIERIVKYWTRHIDISVQLPSGIVVFAVRAFSPDDAVKLANAALDSSEQLVNRMNDQMRRDSVDLAERERVRAQEKLAQARANLERARNEEGMLSADVASKSLTELETEVKRAMIKLQQDYDSARRFVTADAPQLKNLRARISAAQGEVAKLQAQMTAVKTAAQTASATGGPAPRILSGSMSRLDYATLENTIAEKIYAGSLTALEHAKLVSETKLMYINTFVRPTTAEEAKYPRRILDIALIASAGFFAWLALAGILLIVRNRWA